MSEVTEQQLEDMEALFVQTAASMTSEGGVTWSVKARHEVEAELRKLVSET